jgi:hypothetical protein
MGELLTACISLRLLALLRLLLPLAGMLSIWLLLVEVQVAVQEMQCPAAAAELVGYLTVRKVF